MHTSRSTITPSHTVSLPPLKILLSSRSPAIRLDVDFEEIGHKYLPLNIHRYNKLTPKEYNDITGRFETEYPQWMEAIRVLPNVEKLGNVYIRFDRFLTYVIGEKKACDFVRDVSTVLGERLDKREGAMKVVIDGCESESVRKRVAHAVVGLEGDGEGRYVGMEIK